MRKTLLSLCGLMLAGSMIAAPVRESADRQQGEPHPALKARATNMHRLQDMKQVQAATRANEAVTPPAGVEPELFSCKWTGFINYYGSPVPSGGMAMGEVVYGDGNEVYLKYPVPSAGIDAWVKGTCTDEKISIPVPQFLCTVYDDWYDETFDLYVNVLKVDFDENDNPWYWNGDDEEGACVEFVRGADGTFSLDLGIDEVDLTQKHKVPQKLLGIVYDLEAENDNSWSMFGDWGEEYTPWTAKPVTLPEGVKCESWAMLYEYQGRLVNVAIDGNDIYVGNLCDELPDAYVKGTIDGDKATLPATYLGITPDVNEFVYFTPALWREFYFDGNDEAHEDYASSEALEFKFDAKAKTLTDVEQYAAIFICSYTPIGEMLPAMIAMYFEPEFRYQSEDDCNADPQDPEFNGAYDMREMYDCDVVEFSLPMENVDGYLLDSNRMYYRFYIDDELLVFTPEVYIGLSETMTDIPYNFRDLVNQDIWSYNGVEHQISIFKEHYTTVGVQSFFEGYDGTTYESAVVTENIRNLGVSDKFADKEVAEVYYIDLTGVRVLNPERGIFVKTTVYTDGSRSNRKVAIR